MENKNSLILGLIRKLTDYGSYPQSISADALESIFSETKDGERDFVNINNDNFYSYVYEKICSDNETLQVFFSEYNIINFGKPKTYKSIVYATHKMGLNLLFTACYKGNEQPGILMSLFMRLLIEKVFETSFFSAEKNKYQPDSFNNKVSELFKEAQYLNYELSVCAIEPFWAKMTLYTNAITMYYCSKENLSTIAINSNYTSLKLQNYETYKVFNIDYIKNSTFYLPTFALEKDESSKAFVFTFRELLPEISKLDVHKQEKEIQALFHSATPEQQQSFAGNSMLIFKM